MAQARPGTQRPGQGVNKPNRSQGFGHESNPEKLEVIVEKGDVLIIPAGVGHKLLDDFHSGFELVGSYPRGMHCDMCCGKNGESGKVNGIAGLPWFEKDPVYGDDGPLLKINDA